MEEEEEEAEMCVIGEESESSWRAHEEGVDARARALSDTFES